MYSVELLVAEGKPEPSTWPWYTRRPPPSQIHTSDRLVLMYSFTVSDVPAASSVCCGQSSRVVGRYDLVFVGGLVFVPPEVPPSVGSVVCVTVTFGDGLAEGVLLLAVFSARSR